MMSYLLKTGRYHCYVSERCQEPEPNYYVFCKEIWCSISEKNERTYLEQNMTVLTKNLSFHEAVEFLRTYHESEWYDSISDDEMWYCVIDEQEKFERALKELGLSTQ